MSLPARVASALAIGLSFATASTAQITVREIPHLEEGRRCFPRTINEAGQVLLACDGGRTSIWSAQTGQHSEIVFSPELAASVWSMNELGQLSGNVFDSQNNAVGFIWSRESGISTLPGTSLVLYVNSAGEAIVGIQENLPGQSILRLHLRFTDGNMIPLPRGWGAAFSKPLNNLGQVALFSSDMRTWAVWSSAQGLVELPVPAVPPSGLTSHDLTTASAINDAGQIAGSRGGRALLYTPSVGFQILSPEAAGSQARDVNALGHVSGEATPDLVNFSAMLWRSGGDAVALPPYEGASASASASNSAGQIVGVTSTRKTVLWTMPKTPVAPAEHVTSIDSSLTNLVLAGNISPTDAKALTAKLEAVSKSLETADSHAASNQLLALSNQVTALEKSRRISSENASALRTQIANARSSIR